MKTRTKILYDIALTSHEKVLLLTIQEFGGTLCFTYEDIGYLLGTTRTVIQRTVTFLVKKGRITRERAGGRNTPWLLTMV